MAVRLTLQYQCHPSHALILCEPWTRLLVETESPSGNGHVIGDHLYLRKTIDALNIITGFDVEQLQPDATCAQRYLDASAWWLHSSPFSVERFPMTLTVHQYSCDPIVIIPGSRVTTLELRWQDAEANCAPIELRNLQHALPNLTKLSLTLKRVPPSARRPLLNPALLSRCSALRELNLNFTDLSDLTAVAPLEELEDLVLTGCENVKTLQPSVAPTTTPPPPRLYSALRSVSLRDCWHLRDLSPLADAPHLEVIYAGHSGVRVLTGLNRCRALRQLRVQRCWDLTDLSALSGAPCLEEIAADESSISTLTGLNRCQSLRVITVTRCRYLDDLAALAEAPSLEMIVADYSGLRSLTALHTCPSLRHVSIAHCTSVSDIAGLAGAPSLEVIDVSHTYVGDLSPLHGCDKLRKVNITSCRQIDDLWPLAGAPALETIVADLSGVCSLRGLNTCRSLRTVSFQLCDRLGDLSELAGAPCLEEITADMSAIQSVTGLASCPLLQRISLCKCSHLSDLSPLAGAPSLVEIQAAYSYVSDVGGLEKCPRLRTLDLDHTPCAQLSRSAPQNDDSLE